MVTITDEVAQQIISQLQKQEVELQILKAMMAAKNLTWVTKDMMIALTGFKSATIDTYASTGKIVKRGNLYSYRSYLEFCGIFAKGGRNVRDEH